MPDIAPVSCGDTTCTVTPLERVTIRDTTWSSTGARRRPQAAASGRPPAELPEGRARSLGRARALDGHLEDWRRERAADLRRGRWRSTWHTARARGVEDGIEARVALCDVGTRRTLCTSCGSDADLALHCWSRACEACTRRFWRKTRRRVLAAAGEVEARERHFNRRRGRGRKRTLRMVTLTVRHSGNVERDLETVRRGWKRLRAWLAAKPREIREASYVLVVEFTEGRDGRGHVHLHVVTWWPWVDYAALGRAWERATDGAGASQPEVSAPRAKHAEQAAAYVAKYATKGVGLDGVSDELAAAWYAATYGRRVLSASSRFWVPWRRCPCCDDLEPMWVALGVQWPREVVSWVDVARPRGPPSTSTQVGVSAGSVDIFYPRPGEVWRRRRIRGVSRWYRETLGGRDLGRLA